MATRRQRNRAGAGGCVAPCGAPAALTAPTGGFATTGPAGGLAAMAGACGGGATIGAAWRGCGTILRGAGWAAIGGAGVNLCRAVGGRSLSRRYRNSCNGSCRLGAQQSVARAWPREQRRRCGGAAASSFFCWIALSTSPGFETRDQSIFGFGACGIGARDCRLRRLCRVGSERAHARLRRAPANWSASSSR